MWVVVVLFHGKVFRQNPVFKTCERFSKEKIGFDTFSSPAWFSSQMFGIQRTAWQKRKTKKWKVWLFRTASISSKALCQCYWLTDLWFPKWKLTCPVALVWQSLYSLIKIWSRIWSKIRLNLSGMKVRHPTSGQVFPDCLFNIYLYLYLH